MTFGTFQIIRFGGLILGFIIGLIFAGSIKQIAILGIVSGILCFWYPKYYYKALGDEREQEWSKMYEYIWVLKNNLTLFDPAKAYMNTKMYIQEHAPNNKELIQGFDDFYKYWDVKGIDPYIEQYYNFSITREITQIVFNMSKTGIFPEESLSSLRQFIIDEQDRKVEKILGGVASKATMFSLPFLMISVILALLVPMIMQLIAFM